MGFFFFYFIFHVFISVQKSVTDFCILTLYLITLLNSVISSNSFGVENEKFVYFRILSFWLYCLACGILIP